MAFGDQDAFQRSVDADLAQMTPLHDFVLVRALSEDGEIRAQQFGDTPVKLFNPGVHMTGDGRWRSDRPRGLRTGTVVAVGRGDKMLHLYCPDCEEESLRLDNGKPLKCRRCSEQLRVWPELTKRASMEGVAVGTKVVYPRVPANEVVINGEVLTYCHLEQHVLAVIE